MPFQDSDRMHKREFIRVSIHAEGGFVHKCPYGKMKQEKPIELLSHQVRSLTAQYYLRTTQMHFKLVQSVFDFPALVIQSGQFARWSLLGIEKGCYQAIPRFRRSPGNTPSRSPASSSARTGRFESRALGNRKHFGRV